MWENQLEHNRHRGEKRQLNIWIIYVTDFPKVKTEQKRPEKMTYKITENVPNMKKLNIWFIWTSHEPDTVVYIWKQPWN